MLLVDFQFCSGDLSDDILNVYLEVASSSDDAATVRPYFQLWGNDATGKAIPGLLPIATDNPSGV